MDPHVVVIVIPEPEEWLVISSPEAQHRMEARGLSGFCELLVDMLPDGVVAIASDEPIGEIIFRISDGPGFRADPGGEWGNQLVREAFCNALQFLVAD